MAEIDLFEKLTLSQIARWLDLHPFDVARVLGHEGALPARLSFDEGEVDHIRNLSGVETWWDGGSLPITDNSRGRGLVRSLAHKLLHRGEERSTRADNLTRGLEGDDQSLVRRVVNQLIRDGVLASLSSARGLEVMVARGQLGLLESIAEGRDIPKSLEALAGPGQ